MSRGPVIVVAPDSMKGSCSAAEAAAALAAGARAALGASATILELPLADGGEGTLDALVAAWGGRAKRVPTFDALGRPREGRIGLSADGRSAIIEAAEANGLPHVQDRELRPLDADSAGVGVLIAAALDAGAEELLLCIGGSATNDGGAGMLRALGARLLNAQGEEIAPGARGLAELNAIALGGLHPAASGATWRVAVDVDNPLTGPRGAAAVFGPQKGADPGQVAEIDRGLARLARVLMSSQPSHPTADTGVASGVASSLAARPGMGAAGGLALGPAALWGSELVPGADLVATAAGLDRALATADLVLTGEGRFDRQSLSGKMVSRVLSGASRLAVPVAVVAGEVALTAEECRTAGVVAALSIAQGPAGLDELRASAPRLIAEAAAHGCALFAAGRGWAPAS